MATTITVAYGDGIGPEIMEATLGILSKAGASLNIDEVEIGEQVYKSGNTSGIAAETWDTIRKNKVFLKAPITTPQGGGYKSLNVTTRKALGLFANIRPCRGFHPFIRTFHPNMDLVIVRENEEDLYAGIEHRQTDEVVQCLKLISRPGCEKIVRYAFEYARSHGRKKVSCFTKDNIMKQTDGLFHEVFREIAVEYPEIENDHWIIDIGAARLADSPEIFDVIVTLNLYGDIISDIAAQISGSVGLGGSANIGEQCAMFEAIHGSAPPIAVKNVANPSGLLHGAIQMLDHIGQGDVANTIYNAWLRTIEDGIHTEDIYRTGLSKERVGTKEFADAVVNRLGKKPKTLDAAASGAIRPITIKPHKRQPAAKKELVGVDVFVHWAGSDPEEIAEILRGLNEPELSLVMITNRGIKVWPGGFSETFCTDHWRCRYQPTEEGKIIQGQHVVDLLKRALDEGVDIIKTENLFLFDGKRGFSLGQGQ